MHIICLSFLSEILYQWPYQLHTLLISLSFKYNFCVVFIRKILLPHLGFNSIHLLKNGLTLFYWIALKFFLFLLVLHFLYLFHFGLEGVQKTCIHFSVNSLVRLRGEEIGKLRE